MWTFLDLVRRRITPSASRLAVKQSSVPRRRRLQLELLEDRTVPSTYSISSTLNSTSIAAGDTLWFSSTLSGVSGVGSTPASIVVTNQTITFSDSLAGNVSLTLPNAVLTVTPGETTPTATTTFNTSLNEWSTNVPTGLGLKLFAGGYALSLPSGLHGGDSVTWTATFTSDVSGLSGNWQWAAAAYSSFSNSNYGSLGIKPCDNASDSQYKNSDSAGSPENYKSSVISGGTGTGGTNYTGNFTSGTAVSPALNANYVNIGGTFYANTKGTGVYSSGEPVLSGVTMTLTGTTTTGQSITATTTTASNGTYTFVDDSNSNPLVAGTYQIAATPPFGFSPAAPSAGTVNSATDGTVSGSTITSISLAAGQSGVGYNFGNNPFVTNGFNGTAVAAGNYLWFVSVFNDITGVGSTPATIDVTNQAISFTDSLGGTFDLTLPNAVLTLVPGATTATTTFNSSLNEWVTSAPSGLGGNIFVCGIAVPLPSGLAGGASGNGFASAGTGQGGVTIYLYNSTTNLGTGSGYFEEATTASNGAYSFTDLAPGTYYVQAAVPSGYVQTGGGPGGSAGETYYTITGTNGLAYSGYNFDEYLIPTYSPTNISYTVTTPSHSSTTVTNLSGETQEGDTVTANFTVPSGPNETLTLVSYYAPASSFSDSNAYQQLIYQVDTATLAPGTSSLTVHIPNYDYQIDFVVGPAITQLEPLQNDDVYGQISRHGTSTR